jgi:hypothetical protein
VSAELPPGVGTVGEELSKLLAALSARQGGAPGAAPEEGLADPADEASVTADPEAVEDEVTGCTCGCHAGSVPMGRAQVCSLCPLCQGIATLRSLNPELLDRLAHLAALAADTLRELAAEAAAGRAAPRPESPRPRPTRPGRVDIDVVDEPSGDARGGGEARG